MTAKPAAATKAPAARKAPARRASSRSAAKNAPTLREDHTPSEGLAFELIGERPDLAPSVNRIMAAELNDDGKVSALGLFRASLGVIGDPHRTPANAIAAAQAEHGVVPAPG